MSLSADIVEGMIEASSNLPEPPLLLTREEALMVIEEQESVGGCRGPLCRRLLGLPSSWGFETAYAITSRGLVPVAGGELEIISSRLYTLQYMEGFLGLFHTHPGGLAVPSPHDILGAARRGSRVECVGGNTWGRPTVLCIETREPGRWRSLARAWLDLERDIMSSDYFAPYPAGSVIVMVPAPTPAAAVRIENKALALAEENGFNAFIAEGGVAYKWGAKG